MKCQAFINSETRIALDGEALEAASKNPDSPRCWYELEAGDVFCPMCGVQVEIQQRLTGSWHPFRGRATRKEYWKVFSILLGSVAIVVCLTIADIIRERTVVCRLFGIILGLCSIPISVRRLHDLGVGGWILFLSIGINCAARGMPEARNEVASLFLWCCALAFDIYWGVLMGFARGTKGQNKYGADPLETK